MKKRISVLLLCLVLLVTSTACTKQEKSATSGEKVKIGISVHDMGNSYYVNLVNGAQEKADELGYELIVDDPKNDPSKQINAMENFIAMGVDAIIIVALDPPSIEPLCQEAMDKGIKVISQSSKVETSDVFVSADEYDMGHAIGIAAGNWIADKLNGEAEYAVLAYDVIETVKNRKRGIIEGIAEKAPNAKVVSVQDAVTIEDGMRIIEGVIQSNPNLKAVVGVNDAGALGALAAIEAAGVDTTNFFVGGVDLLPQAVEKMKAGTAYRASVDNVPFENGKMDIEIAAKLLNGEHVDEYVPVPVVAVLAEDLK